MECNIFSVLVIGLVQKLVILFDKVIMKCYIFFGNLQFSVIAFFCSPPPGGPPSFFIIIDIQTHPLVYQIHFVLGFCENDAIRLRSIIF